MGRIRSIKPEILEDQKAASLPDDAWRLWVSMWTLADDHGRLPGSTDYLLKRVFWAGRKTKKQVQAALDRLIDASLVRRYPARGAEWCEIANWRKHQRINRPSPVSYPGPEESLSHTNESAEVAAFSSESVVNDHDTLTADSPQAHDTLTADSRPTHDPCSEHSVRDWDPEGIRIRKGREGEDPARERGKLRKLTFDRLVEIRDAAAAARGTSFPPLDFVNGIESRDLAQRIQEAGANAAAQCDHVIAVREQQAKRPKAELGWICCFTEGAWATSIRTDRLVAQAQKAEPDPNAPETDEQRRRRIVKADKLVDWGGLIVWDETNRAASAEDIAARWDHVEKRDRIWWEAAQYGMRWEGDRDREARQ